MTNEKPKKPQILTENERNPELVRTFLSKYRDVFPETVPMNIPTSCILVGRKAKKPVELIAFIGQEEVYIYWDEGNSLRKDKVQKVIEFWDNREQWEDYDFCIFPESLEWCIGFTHNDYCVLCRL